MARFEYPAEDEAASAPSSKEFRDAVRAEVRKHRPKKVVVHRRSIFSCCGCSWIIVVGLIVLVGWGAVIVGRTGLVAVPFVQQWYPPAEPTRVVTTTLGQPASLPPIDQATGTVTVTEQQATEFLRSSALVHQQVGQMIDVSTAQLVFTPNQFELYADLLKPRPTTLLLTGTISPSDDEQLQVVPRQLIISSWPVPATWTTWLVDRSVNDTGALENISQVVSDVTFTTGTAAATIRQ